MRGQKPPLDVRVVGEAGGEAEELLVDLETDRRLVVRRWHEDALLRRDLRAEDGRRIEVREEDQDIVLLVVPLQVLEQRRTPRALLPQPLELVLARVRVVEDPCGVTVE